MDWDVKNSQELQNFDSHHRENHQNLLIKVLRAKVSERNGKDWKLESNTSSPRGISRNGWAGWHMRFMKEWIQPSCEDSKTSSRTIEPRKYADIEEDEHPPP